MLTAGQDTSRTSLARILDGLGETLLEVIGGQVSGVQDVGGSVIYDPVDALVPPRQAIILGVGVHDVDQINELLYSLGRSGAAALVVRSPVEATDQLLRAVRKSGVVLLGLTRGASWTQLSTMLRTIIVDNDSENGSPQSFGGVPAGDLFAVANAVSALIDAPVTIEDRGFNILAFSKQQDATDPSRIEAILGRRVPERFTQEFERSGAIDRLYRSEAPIYIDQSGGNNEPGTLSRVAIAVRAGSEVLGSIWVAVTGPLDEEKNIALTDASKLVALHLLQMRTDHDSERRFRTAVVRSALGGGPAAAEALARLGLLGRPLSVVALRAVEPSVPHGTANSPSRMSDAQRLADAFGLHVSAFQSQAAVAMIDDVVYGLIPVSDQVGGTSEYALQIATSFLNRTGPQAGAVIGIGPVSADGSGLDRCRAGADRALRVLLDRSEPGQVARYADVHAASLLLELGDIVLARGDQVCGPIQRLKAYDQKHASHLLVTLRSWLDAFGDVAAASAATYVHANTTRYRLRRAAEVGGLDLEDAEDRFAVMLQLRIFDRFADNVSQSEPASTIR